MQMLLRLIMQSSSPACITRHKSVCIGGEEGANIKKPFQGEGMKMQQHDNTQNSALQQYFKYFKVKK